MDGEGALIDEPPCAEEPPAAVEAVLRPDDPEVSRRTAATKVLSVLQSFRSRRDAASLADLVRRSRLPRSTVHRTVWSRRAAEPRRHGLPLRLRGEVAASCGREDSRLAHPQLPRPRNTCRPSSQPYAGAGSPSSRGEWSRDVTGAAAPVRGRDRP
ncbi:helix-turn-helix domain-containing protein [Lentzea jiangxiensis]|uniref:helix-turn-helix domain-containing protein n=1 Tax=Lentzea jiangxiensis TaxID=641025 RepID=UPI000B7C7293